MASADRGNARVMLVTGKPTTSPVGGREKLGRLNRDLLRELLGDRLVVVELEKPARQGGLSLVAGLRGHIDGLNRAVIAATLSAIEERDIGLVFLDGSNLGELAAAIKAQAPGVSVCSFFHNVEARFFWGSLKRRRSPRALAVLAVNYLAERKAVRHSDTIIALTARDSCGLKRLYGREATHISAMALDEPAATQGAVAGQGPKYALFVGGTFYANRAGIGWFAEQVAPRIALKTCIVGHGFEAFRQELERPGKVAVVGGVDDLQQWYQGAHVIIAPIFDGSGMKTKVAEALMYGKKIVGTAEAFSGYEDVADRAGWQCATADDFVAALDAAQALELPGFDPELRALFDANYSRHAARARMAAILGMPVLERSVP